MADDAKRGLFDVLEDCLMKSRSRYVCGVCDQQHARGEDKKRVMYNMYLCNICISLYM